MATEAAHFQCHMIVPLKIRLSFHVSFHRQKRLHYITYLERKQVNDSTNKAVHP